MNIYYNYISIIVRWALLHEIQMTKIVFAVNKKKNMPAMSCHDLVFSALVHQLFWFLYTLKCANEAFCWRSPADAPIIHRCKYVEFLSLLSFSLSHYHTGGSTYVWHLRAAPFIILPYNYILSVFANLDFDWSTFYVFSWANATFRFVCLLSFWFSWRNIESDLDLLIIHESIKSDAKFSREKIKLDND